MSKLNTSVRERLFQRINLSVVSSVIIATFPIIDRRTHFVPIEFNDRFNSSFSDASINSVNLSFRNFACLLKLNV